VASGGGVLRGIVPDAIIGSHLAELMWAAPEFVLGDVTVRAQHLNVVAFWLLEQMLVLVDPGSPAPSLRVTVTVHMVEGQEPHFGFTTAGACAAIAMQ
jgi:hypothetical protein